jgi:hypothetical protein
MRDTHESTPVLVAGIATTVLLIFNLMLAVMVANSLRGLRPLPEARMGNVQYLTVVALLIVSVGLMSSAWVANGNFTKLQMEFAKGTPHREAVRNILFWTYIILSAATPFAFAIIRHAVRA